MGTISLDAAHSALEQAMRDYGMAVDGALSADRVADRMAMSMVLTALRYIEKHGLTDGGRRQLRTAIEATRNVLGVE